MLDCYLQLFPPGTQRPVWPLAAVQVSCFKLVLATQHAPLGTGRLSFWRRTLTALRGALRTPSTSRVPAEAMAARPKTRVARENCILNLLKVKKRLFVWLVGCSKEDVRCESRPADQRKRKELKIVGRLKLLVEYRTEEARTKLSVLSRHLILFDDNSCDASPALSQTSGDSWYVLPLTEASSRNWPWCCWGKLGYSHRSCIDAY